MTIYKENALIWWRGIGWSSDWRPAGLVLFPSVEKIVLTEGLRGYDAGVQPPDVVLGALYLGWSSCAFRS